ncbi:uncharacterized protein MONOS_1363 [Monocercomonoides exilis]|uniref:uncharacterized protein n=1 Tax=Monocercomonoides exilis TaxID=2049356 RepID=UPI0035595CA1|nr:hypothetical protein MONOS_1363 [Monocercomonoides exilis]|eukprot:MONOS_1363.1-p1 / transcript=MONOS_1363.1 / gene=MONOS_1363 / organism=Monocercomonoides_exilis_PA203 / gene_product=unspecified product / transcript_product=unspecified product / location=Mono_scaffold00023:188897-189211(+) / protein_length=105 / sequence_SO=supercontig / SO=protein_coding / is_pseudo=false
MPPTDYQTALHGRKHTQATPTLFLSTHALRSRSHPVRSGSEQSHSPRTFKQQAVSSSASTASNSLQQISEDMSQHAVSSQPRCADAPPLPPATSSSAAMSAFRH